MLLVLIVYRVCGDLGRITLATDYLERESEREREGGVKPLKACPCT